MSKHWGEFCTREPQTLARQGEVPWHSHLGLCPSHSQGYGLQRALTPIPFILVTCL